ncbi:MAG: hypothetical protein HY815_09020 [Candidatus Riflebacteria bacterium]|nr:hypothetical protein [Candidatus Riflebacteria bacterium]
MGLFDKIKSAVKMVTGGSAAVTLELGPRRDDGSYPARVKAVVSSTDLEIGRVYLAVEGLETVRYKIKEPGSEHETEQTLSETTFKTEVDIAPAQSLVANKEYLFEGLFSLPADAPHTYLGKNARHEWRVYAGLDASGTDPASSWTAFTHS